MIDLNMITLIWIVKIGNILIKVKMAIQKLVTLLLFILPVEVVIYLKRLILKFMVLRYEDTYF